MQNRRDAICKRPLKRNSFTLIELLVCLSIIITISSVLISRGVSFVQRSNFEQEAIGFCHLLNCGYQWTDLEQKPLDFRLKIENGELILTAPLLKLKKSYKKLSLKPLISTFTLYPNMLPETRKFTLIYADGEKYIEFDPDKERFILN